MVELLNRLERTFVLHRVLVGIFRLLAECTGGRYETLRADSGRYIVGCQSVLRHYVGFEPNAQGVGVTEVVHITYTRDTHNTRFDVDVDKVRDEVIVVLAVGGFESGDLQDTVLHLTNRHADLRHIAWQ